MSLEAQDTVDAADAESFDARRVKVGEKIRAARSARRSGARPPRASRTTAEAYFVKAGDYIQIIDVDGRQCTDFQCFSARKLDRGKDHPLDVTTTRTLMGASYPMPGLHSKYYDRDMEPLVEVVQDTCGRHDAFALACAAKYYDDIGYPGHANCSDQLQQGAADKGVTPAPAGWR